MQFDTSSRDSQGTSVTPIDPQSFDFEQYADYAKALDQKVKPFMESDSGVLVYRRYRVAEVFADGCRDMKNSLSLQLAALQQSMNYKADVANFLEPWYGIGSTPAAFGAEYIWHPGQAPATKPLFDSIQEALDYDILPIAETEPGKKTLEYIDYFLETTRGLVPMSMSDIQSPINAAGNIVDISKLFLEMIDEPEKYGQFLDTITELILEFLLKQRIMIGDRLVLPGHGFASSRFMKGVGLSDDNIVMISNASYRRFDAPDRERLGEPFGGVAFHSCGNWEKKIPAVKSIGNLVEVDGAFSASTDPDPNVPEAFRDAFKETGIILHARMVGDSTEIVEIVKRIWSPGLKLIVCTYCQSPEDQARAYDLIHEICQ